MDQKKIDSIFEKMKCALCGEPAISAADDRLFFSKVAHCFPKLSANLMKATYVDDSWFD